MSSDGRREVKRLVVSQVVHIDQQAPTGADGQPLAPRRWHHVLAAVATGLGDPQPRRFRMREVLAPGREFLFWHPGPEALSIGLAGRRLVYLCWGMPSPEGHPLSQRAKRERLRLVLKLAHTVAVNDEVTAAEVQALTGRQAVRIPYLVDTDFFAYGAPEQRGMEVLVPGDNDRDELLVRELARTGTPVVRVTRSEQVASYHRQRGALVGLDVRMNVPFTELRRLYQTVQAVLLPIGSCHHAAGQTSLLEALSAGAPVIISAGRVATIGANYPLVQVCADNRLLTWQHALGRVRGLLAEDLTRSSAEQVAQTHHPDRVAANLLELLERG